MTNNDILRRIRYALNINNPTMIRIFQLSGHEMDNAALINLLKKEDETGFVECSPAVFGFFLDGLISLKRGRKELAPGQAEQPDAPLTNNDIVKKLRIALELNEEAMLGILQLAGVTLSKPALSALFRKKGHGNYKECGDQFLRNFLKGLALHYRRA